MRSDKSRPLRKWSSGEILALALLFLGLADVLFVAATEGEYAVWTLWIAVPMLMVSLLYILLVNALPIFFGHTQNDEPEEERPPERREE